MYPFSPPPCIKIQTESFLLWCGVIATLYLNTAHQTLFILLKYSPSTLIYTAAVHHQRAPHWVPGREEAITYLSQYINVILAYCCTVAMVYPQVYQQADHLVSRGRKSKLLFNSGKRKAEALMTSVGFGVTRPRTCCFRQTITLHY